MFTFGFCLHLLLQFYMRYLNYLLPFIINFIFQVDCSDDFSGFYTPDLDKTSEDYAGAWFLRKERLIMANASVSVISNLEGATFHVLRIDCDGCKTFLSRDYFDFMDEHLSSTTNQVPHITSISDILLKRMKRKANSMMKMAKKKLSSQEIDARTDLTVAVMVFSSNSVSSHDANQNLQREIRNYYFQATFWSLYTYFKYIVIFTGSGKDSKILEDMKLPIWHCYDLSKELEEETKKKWNGKGPPPAPVIQQTPKLALLHTINALSRDTSWDWIKYVYYTEGDLLLHLRSSSKFFDLFDQSNFRFTAVPHRMQVKIFTICNLNLILITIYLCIRQFL